MSFSTSVTQNPFYGRTHKETFLCTLCEIECPTEQKLQDHFKGRRHLELEKLYQQREAKSAAEALAVAPDAEELIPDVKVSAERLGPRSRIVVEVTFKSDALPARPYYRWGEREIEQRDSHRLFVACEGYRTVLLQFPPGARRGAVAESWKDAVLTLAFVLSPPPISYKLASP